MLYETGETLRLIFISGFHYNPFFVIGVKSSKLSYSDGYAGESLNLTAFAALSVFCSLMLSFFGCRLSFDSTCNINF